MSSSTRARRLATLVVLPVVLLLAWAAPASAHPYLLSSSPAVGSTVTAPPTALLLSFTEPLNQDYSHVVLVAPDDTDVRTTLRRGGPPTALQVVLAQPLKLQGTYAVEWTAVGKDGHTVAGSFPISLGHTSLNAALHSVSTSGTPDLERGLVGRSLGAAFPVLLVLLAGTLLLEGRVRRPRLRLGLTVAALLALGGLLLQPDDTNQTRLLLEGGLLLVLLARPPRPVVLSSTGGLLLLLAASGHVESASGTGRLALLALYVVHLAAVSTWLGCLVAAVFGRREGLLRLVIGSLSTLVVTGVLLTSWALRGLSQLTTTRYGQLLALKVGLLAVALLIGIAATRRTRRVEAAFAVGIAVTAGVLGQASVPRDLPLPSQLYAEGTGLPVSVAALGNGLVTGVVTPGTVGANSLLVRVTVPDAQDFQRDVTTVSAVSAVLRCTCAPHATSVTLQRVPGSSWWRSDLPLPAQGRWSISAEVDKASAELSATVLPASIPGQVVVGVPADLSGATGQQCLDQVLGLQAAIADVNARGTDHGKLVRVVVADTHDDPAAAVASLKARGATSLAVPCGRQIASTSGLPVINAGIGGFSVRSNARAEGVALGQQARTQGAALVTAVVGTSASDAEALAGLRSTGVPVRVVPVPRDPKALATQLSHGVDLLALLAEPAEALPLTQQLSLLNQRHWAPVHGLLATSSLMDPDFINAAGWITRTGTIEFASDVNPFDPGAQYYAQRLRELTPGERPTFNGLHGFNAGLLLASALRYGGGSPTPTHLATVLATRFRDTEIGSSRVSWSADGGSASALAFFRSTYVSPMAASPLTPGGATSLNHEGTFLNSGGFEQISPFRKLA